MATVRQSACVFGVSTLKNGIGFGGNFRLPDWSLTKFSACKLIAHMASRKNDVIGDRRTRSTMMPKPKTGSTSPKHQLSKISIYEKFQQAYYMKTKNSNMIRCNKLQKWTSQIHAKDSWQHHTIVSSKDSTHTYIINTTTNWKLWWRTADLPKKYSVTPSCVHWYCNESIFDTSFDYLWTKFYWSINTMSKFSGKMNPWKNVTTNDYLSETVKNTRTIYVVS